MPHHVTGGRRAIKLAALLVAGAAVVLLFQPQIRVAALRVAGEGHEGGVLVLAAVLNPDASTVIL